MISIGYSSGLRLAHFMILATFLHQFCSTWCLQCPGSCSIMPSSILQNLWSSLDAKVDSMELVRRRRLPWASRKGLLQLYHGGWSLVDVSVKWKPFNSSNQYQSATLAGSWMNCFAVLGFDLYLTTDEGLDATFKGNFRNASDNLFYLYTDSQFCVPNFGDQGYE